MRTTPKFGGAFDQPTKMNRSSLNIVVNENLRLSLKLLSQRFRLIRSQLAIERRSASVADVTAHGFAIVCRASVPQALKLLVIHGTDPSLDGSKSI